MRTTGASIARRRDLPPGPPRHVRHTARLEDYGLSACDGDSPYPEIERVVSHGHPWHYRCELAASYGGGWAEFCGWSDGFFVYLSDCELNALRDVSVSAPDMMLIRVGLQGCGEFVDGSGERVAYDGRSALVVIEPPGSAPSRSLFWGRSQAVQIYVSREVLERLYDGDEGELPPVLRAFVARDLTHTLTRRLPLTAGLSRCLEDLQTCSAEGRTRRYFLQCKTMEMLCHIFEALAAVDGGETLECSTIAARGALRAQAILMETFAAPPTLDDLAREVGLSRTGLTAAFRKMFRKSVFDYILDLRMERARVLLNDPASSITQVAYAVGYNHVSSFSVAVQRHFGATPRELKRRATLLGPAMTR